MPHKSKLSANEQDDLLTRHGVWTAHGKVRVVANYRTFDLMRMAGIDEPVPQATYDLAVVRCANSGKLVVERPDREVLQKPGTFLETIRAMHIERIPLSDGREIEIQLVGKGDGGQPFTPTPEEIAHVGEILHRRVS
jgi:hypothetical protein